MFDTFNWNNQNYIRNQFIYHNKDLIQDDYVIGCYVHRSSFHLLNKNSHHSIFAYEPSNSFSTPNRHNIAFEKSTDFENISFGETYKALITPDNLIDIFFEIRKLPANNTQILALGFNTSMLRNNYEFLASSLQDLFTEYNSKKLDSFITKCIEKNIISSNQIKKVEDINLIPFILSDFFVHIKSKNNNFEYFLNYFPIFDNFKSILNITSDSDEKYLIFHYQKIIEFIKKNSFSFAATGNIFYNKPNEDGFQSFIRFFNIFTNHLPEYKDSVIKSILSLPLNGDIGHLGKQTTEILSFLANNEPDLLLYFINHHVQKNLITNRPLASLIKRELPPEFIHKNKDYFMSVMPDLFYEFSWENIKTEKKSSEVFTLPFHHILFSINIFDYYNEEHIFHKYLEYLRIYFDKLNLPIFINYHLETSAFFNKNFIENAHLTISFDGYNENLTSFLLIANKHFFQNHVITNIMSSTNPSESLSNYVRENYLLSITNNPSFLKEQHIVSHGNKKIIDNDKDNGRKKI